MFNISELFIARIIFGALPPPKQNPNGLQK
jgi:hypothetical protein